MNSPIVSQDLSSVNTSKKVLTFRRGQWDRRPVTDAVIEALILHGPLTLNELITRVEEWGPTYVTSRTGRNTALVVLSHLEHGKTRPHPALAGRLVRERLNRVRKQQYKRRGGQDLKARVLYSWELEAGPLLYARHSNEAPEEQDQETPRNAIEFRGERKTLASWSRECGKNYDTLRWRLKNGWSIEEALTTPVKKWGKRDESEAENAAA